MLVAVLGLGVYLLTARYLNVQAEEELSALADFYAAYTAATAADEADLAALAPQIAGFFAPQAGYDVRLFNARTGALLAATRDAGLAAEQRRPGRASLPAPDPVPGRQPGPARPALRRPPGSGRRRDGAGRRRSVARRQRRSEPSWAPCAWC